MIGYKNEFVELLLSSRVNYVSFLELTNDFQSNPHSLDLENGNAWNIFYEPCFTVRVGSEKIKGIVQSGFSIRHNPIEKSQFRNREFIFNIGIMYNFGLK